jgi:hypothetical protein
MVKEQLTSEALKKHFKNNFELCEFAIRVARHYVAAGQEVNITSLLEDIQRNPDFYKQENLDAMDKADNDDE